MSSNKFQNKYRIPSARAGWHDYSGGVYFITICTADREHYFGEISDGEMVLSEIGKYADECVRGITNHFSDVVIPLYVIMPNHIHLIVFIDGTRRDGACPVSTMTMTITSEMPKNINEKMQIISHCKGRLSSVVGSIKSVVTRHANQNNIPFKWQTRFHDRIIRDQNELNRIAQYIENNPYNWLTDKYY